MRPDIDVAERFVSLVWQAVENPNTPDRAELLRVASEFLDSIAAATGPLAQSGRKLGLAVMDFAMIGTYTKMRQAQQSFELSSRLHIGQRRLARLKDLQD